MSRVMFRVEIARLKGLIVARLEGEIDVSNVDLVERELEPLASSREPRCVVDLSGAEYFDSAGIRLLFSVAMRLRTRRQELHLIVPEGSLVRRLLDIADLESLVPIHRSLEELAPDGGR